MTIIRWMRRTTTGRCSIWVNRVILRVRRRLPVYRDKQTFSAFVGMSQMPTRDIVRSGEMKAAAKAGTLGRLLVIAVTL